MPEPGSGVEQIQSIRPRKKSSFARDVLKLVSGTTLAQALTLLVAPIVARLYGPEAFGVSALFNSIVGIVTVIACMRYELAIMLPDSDEEAANLLGASLGLAFFISGLTILGVWLGGHSLTQLLNAPQLEPYLWLVPLSVFVGGVFTALNYWNSRTKHFGRLSIVQIVNAVTVNGTQLGAGYAGYTNGGSLIGAGFFGSFISGVILWGQIWRDDGSLFRRSIRWHSIFLELKRYRKFLLYSTWSALLNNISWQLPALLLSMFFSSTVVGYYAVGNRLLRLPMNLIGSAIAQVFFQRASEAKIEGTLAVLVEDAFRRLVMLGLFPLLLLTIIGRDLFVVVFGESWAEAGVYVQILSVWMFFWFISSPLSTLFSVLEKQEFGLTLNAIIFVTRFMALGIGGLLGSARIALLLFGLSGVLVYGYLTLAIMAAAGVSWPNMFRILLSSFILFIPAGSVLVGLRLTGASQGVLVLTSCFLLLAYFIYLIATDSQLRHMFLRTGRNEWTSLLKQKKRPKGPIEPTE